MSKVLFIGFPGEGHVNPTIGLVKELVRRGEEVIYYISEDYRKKVEAAGATVRPIENFTKQLMDEPYQAFEQKFAHILRFMDNKAEQLIPQLKEERFDYIIFDAQMLLGKIIAKELELPSVASCTTFADNEETQVLKRASFTEKLSSGDGSHLKEEMERIGKKYGIPIHSFYDFFFVRGDINVVFTSRYFQPEAASFDETYKFVGPSIASRGEEMDLPLDQLTDKPLLYISMGTVFNKQPEVYEKCFEAFGDMDIHVILSIGKRLNISDFPHIPSNFIVRQYVPQLAVLKRANAFITHCGMNSTNEALYHDVPLVMIPVDADQPFVANRVKQLGGGILLEKETLSPTALKEAVEEIFHNPSYRNNAAHIGQSLRESGGVKQAVDEIFALKERIHMS